MQSLFEWISADSAAGRATGFEAPFIIRRHPCAALAASPPLFQPYPRTRRRKLCAVAGSLLAAATLAGSGPRAAETVERRLYVGVPGIRNYAEWGGLGDWSTTWAGPQVCEAHPYVGTPGKEPRRSKGSAPALRRAGSTSSTTARLGCIDLVSEKMLWEKAYAGGCDRMSITPDGKTIYLPSLEGPFWNVVDASNGEHDQEDRAKLGVAQHGGLAGRHAGLSGGAEVAVAVGDRRGAHAHPNTILQGDDVAVIIDLIEGTIDR